MTDPGASPRCPNHEVNLKQCPCTSVDCPRRGFCCECVANHAGKGGKTRCMKEAVRPAATLNLPIGRHKDCANRARNEAGCACTETGCSRHGICCDCIRYHWGNATWPTPACM